MITLRMVANEVGLSRSGVSRALRNDPHMLKDTCERVQATARQMGWLPNAEMSAAMSERRAGSTLTAREKILLNCKPDGECWIWQGSTNLNHYGKVCPARGVRPKLAHRVSYEAFVGPIPAGLCALHRCDRPQCVNPDHLFIGTLKDNTQDMIAKGRRGVCVRRKPSRFYSEASSQKLNSEQAGAIRKDPRIYRLIAADYGISVTMVGLIKKGSAWK